MSRSRWYAAACAAGLGAFLGGCGHGSSSSPEQLRAAYLESLRDDDPKRAYSLLSKDVQATVSYADFSARWKANVAEREAALAAAQAIRANRSLHRGQTAHPHGAVLHWTETAAGYQVTAGLPGAPHAATPAQAVRALIVAVRVADLARVRNLLGDELAAALEADWDARVQGLQEALEQPGAIELSSDRMRAELRYAPHRVLTLEQSDRGWRITAIE